MSDNYYILLGIDPKIDDWTAIEAAIRDRQRRWSREKSQGAPAARRKAERHLKLISDMRVKLQDSEQRKQIAKAAAEELSQREAKHLAKLDELIGMIEGRSIQEKDVAVLIKGTGGDIGEAVVLARLKKRGITVVKRAEEDAKRKSRPKLDESVAQTIRDNLEHLGHENLYEFLSMNQRASPRSLCDAAEQVLKDLYRKGQTDPDSNSRQELAGHCLDVFKDGAQKERYDNTYAAQAMDDFTGHLEVAALDGVISQADIDQVLRKARERGVSREVAMEWIYEFAGKRKLVLQTSAELLAAEVKLCGFCNTLAQSLDDKRCRACGQELVQPCPLCGQLTPTQDECCGDCGCSTGDGPLTNGLLRDGQIALASGDYRRALQCFDKALVYWKDWEPALEGKRQVDARRRTRDAEFEIVAELVKDRKLSEAQVALSRVTREFGTEGTQDAKREIALGLQRAKDMFELAEAMRNKGRTEDAAGKYSEALEYTVDYQPAMRALATCPPPSPPSLSVKLDQSAARLTWPQVRAAGTVRYLVQRKSLGRPTGPEDGTLVAEIAAMHCDDTEMPSGVPVYYAVFTTRGGVPSQKAATSGPHVRLADPADIVAEVADGKVTLRWTRPVGCKSVDVWRVETRPPSTTKQSTRVATAGDSAIDRNLQNGVIYHYVVVASYDDPGGGAHLLRSQGVKLSAIPVAPPAAVNDLTARRNGRTVMLEWTPPLTGSVQLRQTRRLADYSPGQIISLAEADRYGSLVPATGQGSGQAVLTGQGRTYFVPLSVTEQTAVLGKSVCLTLMSEVSALEAHRQGSTIQLLWDWPPGAQEVAIVWKYDGYPADPQDGVSGRSAITRSVYDQAGLWELRDAIHRPHYFTVFVNEPSENMHSSGTNVIEASGMEAVVNYRVVTKKRLLTRSLQEAWVALEAAEVRRLPAIRAVLKRDRPPMQPDDGEEIVDLDQLEFVEGQARIKLPVNGSSGYVKLFFQDGSHAKEFRLHPLGRDQLRLG